MAKSENDLMEKVISLCKRRGFIFPGSEIYGGLQNSWDYGPLGAELKKNIKDEWWNRFVRQRADMVGIDAALIMNPKVWEASGHLKEFTDPLVECKKCHERFRADHLDFKEACPNCSAKGTFTEARQFNMMLKTFLGPVDGWAEWVDVLAQLVELKNNRENLALDIDALGQAQVYLRPETAQAMFVDFKNVLDTARKRLPFGIAQQGKAFRNEITPGNFIFRTREFEQMEIEYFINPKDWEKHFEYWIEQMKLWLKDLGIREERLHFVEIPDGERAHYSKRTVDVEYDYPFGRKELYGIAYRGDFDLQNHMKASGADLQYTDPETNTKFVPHVIEPTWGVDRSLLVALLEAYTEDKENERVYLKFPKWLAPYKVAVFPLLSNKPLLVEKAKAVFDILAPQFTTAWDDRGNVGKRYYAQDEIGTPYCITVDFDTLGEKGDELKDTVTVRDRDSMRQERVKITELAAYLQNQLKQ
jgi:glycyl-tRNA synthetase